MTQLLRTFFPGGICRMVKVLHIISQRQACRKLLWAGPLGVDKALGTGGKST